MTWKKLVTVQISPTRGKLFHTSDHAEFIDGHEAHVIRAKRARALAFTVGGARLFRRVVNHPGTKAPVLAPAMALANSTRRFSHGARQRTNVRF